MELNPTNIEEARLAMHGRLLRCPFGDNPKDCPLHGIRKLPVEERLEWLESKTNAEVVELYQQHRDCLTAKKAMGEQT
jgi:hypothetical protein